MDENAYTYSHQEEARFRLRTQPTIDGFNEWRRRHTSISRELQEARDTRTNAIARRGQILTKDPRSLAWPVWVEVLVVALVAVTEVFFNYLAALGLLQDDTVTWGVTGGLTFLLFPLVGGLAREYRHYRRDDAAGKNVQGLPWPRSVGVWFSALVLSALAYLII